MLCNMLNIYVEHKGRKVVAKISYYVLDAWLTVYLSDVLPLNYLLVVLGC